MEIPIRYSESSRQDASDGIFDTQLPLGSKFSIFGPLTMGYSLTYFLKIGKF